MIELASGSGGLFLHQIYLDELVKSRKMLGLSSSKRQRQRLPSSIKSRQMSTYSWIIYALALKSFVNIALQICLGKQFIYIVIFIMNSKFHTVNAFIIKMFFYRLQRSDLKNKMYNFYFHRRRCNCTISDACYILCTIRDFSPAA